MAESARVTNTLLKQRSIRFVGGIYYLPTSLVPNKDGVSKAEVKSNKYERTIVGFGGDTVQVDVYRVLEAFKVTNPQLQHLVKKALCAGLRGHKDTKQDLLDIEESIQSAIKANEDGK